MTHRPLHTPVPPRSHQPTVQGEDNEDINANIDTPIGAKPKAFTTLPSDRDATDPQHIKDEKATAVLDQDRSAAMSTGIDTHSAAQTATPSVAHSMHQNDTTAQSTNQMTPHPCVLNVEHLSITTLDGVSLVEDLSYQLYASQTLAIVGESGSGKSIASLALLGLLPASLRVSGTAQLTHATASQDSGSLNTGSQDIEIATPTSDTQRANKARDRHFKPLRGQRIGMIFQEPMTALNPLHTVGKQIAESLRLINVPKSQWRTRSLALLHDVNITDPKDKLSRYPHELSGGQRQRVMIAMALAQQPDILIADEPTTALDVTLQHEILALLTALKSTHNMAMILISHDLNLVKRYSDTIIVMRHGKVIEQGSTPEVFGQPKASYTRQLMTQDFGRASVPNGGQDNDDCTTTDASDTVLSVQKLSVRFPAEKSLLGTTKRWFTAVDQVDFRLKTGEALGIVGESGSGKTTIALALTRLLTHHADVSGRVIVAGQDMMALSSAQLRHYRRKVQMVFQDPYASINPRLTVLQIIEEGLRVQGMDTCTRAGAVLEALATVHLPSEFAHRYPHELSGGQRQRVALARALVMKPALLILDEPTSALDSTTQVTVVNLLREIQHKYRISYVFISHDLKVVRALCQHTLIIKAGRVVEYAPSEAIFTQPKHPYARQLLQASIS